VKRFQGQRVVAGVGVPDREDGHDRLAADRLVGELRRELGTERDRHVDRAGA
jgi:hypothetical protein